MSGSDPEIREFDDNVCDHRWRQCCGRHLLTKLEAGKLFVNSSSHTLLEHVLLTHQLRSTGIPIGGG